MGKSLKTQSLQTPDRRHLAYSISKTMLPLGAGALIIIVGALLSRHHHWSVGADWAILIAAILVSGLGFAIPAGRRAPKLPR